MESVDANSPCSLYYSHSASTAAETVVVKPEPVNDVTGSCKQPWPAKSTGIFGSGFQFSGYVRRSATTSAASIAVSKEAGGNHSVPTTSSNFRPTASVVSIKPEPDCVVISDIVVKEEPLDCYEEQQSCNSGYHILAPSTETSVTAPAFSGYVRRSNMAVPKEVTDGRMPTTNSDFQPAADDVKTESGSDVLTSEGSSGRCSVETAIKNEPVDSYNAEQFDCHAPVAVPPRSRETEIFQSVKSEPIEFAMDVKPEVGSSNDDVRCEVVLENVVTGAQHKSKRHHQKDAADDLKVVHFSLSLSDGTVTSRQSYRCCHCGKTSTDHDMMKQHCEENFAAAAACKDRAEMRCRTCSKRFKRPCALEVHEKDSHNSQRSSADKRPFLCDCRRRFRAQLFLDMHKKYKCLYVHKRAPASTTTS